MSCADFPWYDVSRSVGRAHARALRCGRMSDDLVRSGAAAHDRVRLGARLVSERRAVCSAVTLLLAAFVLGALGAGVEPLRAAAVLTFLGPLPVFLVARVAPTLGPAGVATIGAASAVATTALIAMGTLLAGVWAPEKAVFVLAALVGLAALLDLGWAWRRQLRDGRERSEAPITSRANVPRPVIEAHERTRRDTYRVILFLALLACVHVTVDRVRRVGLRRSPPRAR